MKTKTAELKVRTRCPLCKGRGWIGVHLSANYSGEPCMACQGSGWLNRRCQARGQFLAFSRREIRCPRWAVEHGSFCEKHLPKSNMAVAGGKNGLKKP